MLCSLCFIYQKCHLFNNFIFLFSNNMFFINHMLKFKYHACWIKVKNKKEIALKHWTWKNAIPHHIVRSPSSMTWKEMWSQIHNVIVGKYINVCLTSVYCLATPFFANPTKVNASLDRLWKPQGCMTTHLISYRIQCNR